MIGIVIPAHNEERLKVADLERTGARIVWTVTNPVTTRARRDYKCRGGFGAYLASLTPPITHLRVETFLSSDSTRLEAE